MNWPLIINFDFIFQFGFGSGLTIFKFPAIANAATLCVTFFRYSKMQTEKEANFLDRYLLCNYSFSDKTMERVKADVKDFMAARSKDDNYFKFIKWRRTENELAVLTMYAYNDILLPKKYDTVFQIDKPSNFVNVDFTITQAVLDGWAPVNELTKGHKHICVIRFDQEVHNIFRLLALFDPSTTGQDKIQLGFCNLSDFEEIKINLRYV